jgi:hypothetical protein
LKKICEISLVDSISVETVAQIFLMADSFLAECLKVRVGLTLGFKFRVKVRVQINLQPYLNLDPYLDLNPNLKGKMYGLHCGIL